MKYGCKMGEKNVTKKNRICKGTEHCEGGGAAVRARARSDARAE